jgi:hypothetical protein
MRNCLPAVSLLALFGGNLDLLVAAGSRVSLTTSVRADLKSGRLVRRTFAPSLKKLGRQELRELIQLDKLVDDAAKKYGVDPLLIQSVIEVESNHNPFAVSPKGAEGLMQLIGPTARRFGIRNSFSPPENIDGGVRYLKYLQDLFQDERLALAAYNAGEGAVAKYNRIPPYPETKDYVQRVRARYEELKSEQSRSRPSIPEAPGEPQYRPLEAFIDTEGRLHLRTR